MTQYTLITTERDLEEALEHLSGSPVLGVDTETTGLDPYQSRIRLIQLATAERAFIVDLFRVPALGHKSLRHLLSSPRPI